MVPLAARTFVNRCRPGSTGSFEGTAVHRALRGLAVYAGLSHKCVARLVGGQRSHSSRGYEMLYTHCEAAWERKTCSFKHLTGAAKPIVAHFQNMPLFCLQSTLTMVTLDFLPEPVTHKC